MQPSEYPNESSICFSSSIYPFNLSLVIKAYTAAAAPPTLPTYQDISPGKYPITAYPASNVVTTQVRYDEHSSIIIVLL